MPNCLHFVPRACVLTLLLAAPALALTLNRAATLAAKPADCASYPPTVTRFATTDPLVALAFTVTGQKAGDVAAVDYVMPNGTVYAAASGPWPALTAANAQADGYCFMDTSLLVAGAPAASATGTWLAKITINGVPLVTLAFVMGGTAPATSLVNGGFEQPASSGSSTAAAGSSGITGWMVTHGNVDSGGSAVRCSEGSQCLHMGGGTLTGGVWQAVATTAGTPYTVLFDLAGNPDGAPAVKHLRVIAAGYSRDYSFDTAGKSWSAMGWQTGQFSFVAASAVTTIEFYGTDPPTPFGPMLDNVRLTADSGSSPLTGNLLQNGDAEAGPSGTDAGLASIPGWTTDGDVAVTPYQYSGGVLTDTSTAPADKGHNYFAGGYSATSKITQTVSLSASAANIDAGTQGFTLDGWLGGYGGQDDSAVLRVVFQNSLGGTLGSLPLGPVLAADRGGVSGLIHKTATGKVSVGARKAIVSLEFTRQGGSYNDGAADSLYFGLTAGGECTYVLDRNSQTVGAAAASISVAVQTGSACKWTASSSASWIQVGSGSSGTGNGTVSLQVAANADAAARTGSVTIAGNAFTVSQAAAAAVCAYSIDPPGRLFPAEGAKGVVSVTTAAGCNWTATTQADWVSLLGSGGAGSGRIEYRVSPNTSATPRAATLTVAGERHSVSQAAQAAPNSPLITSLVNWADDSGEFAPGTWLVIQGNNLASAAGSYSTSLPPYSLNGASVEFTDGTTAFPAPMLSTAPDSLIVLIPYELEEPAMQVVVTSESGSSAPSLIELQSAAPRVAAPRGEGMVPATAYHSDSSQVTAGTPAVAGESILVIVAGLGRMTPSLAPGAGGGDGSDGNPSNRATVPVTAYLGGQFAPVQYAGVLPGSTEGQMILLKIPDHLPTGEHELVIAAGGYESAGGVTLPVSADSWASGAAAMLNANEGAVSYGGLTLAVPANSLTTGATVVVSRNLQLREAGKPVFTIAGLPAEFGPATLTVDVAASEGAPCLVRLRNLADEAAGAISLPATVTGGRVSVELPASAGSATAKAKSREGYQAYPTKTIRIQVDENAMTEISPSGRMWVRYSDAILQPKAVILAKLMDDIDSYLTGTLGMSWDLSARPQLPEKKRSWPLIADIYPFTGSDADKWASEGSISLVSGKATQGVDINEKRVRNDADFPEIRPTLAHEMFHVIQNLYDTRTAYDIRHQFMNTWLWYEEAASTWLERRFAPADFIPSTVKLKPGTNDQSDNFTFLKSPMGLVNTPSYGYGSSMFLETLHTSEGPAVVSKILNDISAGTGVSSYTPLEAMRRQLGDDRLSGRWIQFCRAWMGSKVYPGVSYPPPGDILAGTFSEYKPYWSTKPGGTESISWKAPPLSAQMFSPTFMENWPDNTPLKVTLIAPPGAEMVVYSLHQGRAGDVTMDLEAEGVTQYTFQKGELVTKKNSSRPMIMVVNGNVPTYHDVTVSGSAYGYSATVTNKALDEATYKLEFSVGGETASFVCDLPVRKNSDFNKYPRFKAVVSIDGPGAFYAGQLNPARAAEFCEPVFTVTGDKFTIRAQVLDFNVDGYLPLDFCDAYEDVCSHHEYAPGGEMTGIGANSTDLSKNWKVEQKKEVTNFTASEYPEGYTTSHQFYINMNTTRRVMSTGVPFATYVTTWNVDGFGAIRILRK
ncbi:choice-of-anchor C family protein [Paludibaculum fermentans]|uniref:Choice-of-anchor C family protein n=1 Tax=Paludibaculum fermentans TaxID=1473598 RepID=A0A7S7SNL3_PALFE|nr:choice-of-anchor C family protein [Paludibaculum fermentans]QOY91028.1 choice-of-anchor C family protein [Paludibaculum fermentans]